MSVKPHDARFRSLYKSVVPEHRNVSEAKLKAVEGVNRQPHPHVSHYSN